MSSKDISSFIDAQIAQLNLDSETLNVFEGKLGDVLNTSIEKADKVASTNKAGTLTKNDQAAIWQYNTLQEAGEILYGDKNYYANNKHASTIQKAKESAKQALTKNIETAQDAASVEAETLKNKAESLYIAGGIEEQIKAKSEFYTPIANIISDTDFSLENSIDVTKIWENQLNAYLASGGLVIAEGGQKLPFAFKNMIDQTAISDRGTVAVNAVQDINNKIAEENNNFQQFLQFARNNGVSEETIDARTKQHRGNIKKLQNVLPVIEEIADSYGLSDRIKDAVDRGWGKKKVKEEKEAEVGEKPSEELSPKKDDRSFLEHYSALTDLTELIGSNGKLKVAKEVATAYLKNKAEQATPLELMAILLGSATGRSDLEIAQDVKNVSGFLAETEGQVLFGDTKLKGEEFKDPGDIKEIQKVVKPRFDQIDQEIDNFNKLIESGDDLAASAKAGEIVARYLYTGLEALVKNPKTAALMATEEGVQFFVGAPVKLAAKGWKVVPKYQTKKQKEAIDAKFEQDATDIETSFRNDLAKISQEYEGDTSFAIPGAAATAVAKQNAQAKDLIAKRNADLKTLEDTKKARYAALDKTAKFGDTLSNTTIMLESAVEGISVYSAAMQDYMEKTGGKLPNAEETAALIAGSLLAGGMDYFVDGIMGVSAGALKKSITANKKAGRAIGDVSGETGEVLSKGMVNHLLRATGKAVDSTLTKVKSSKTGRIASIAGRTTGRALVEAGTEAAQTDLQLNLANYLLGKDREANSNEEAFMSSIYGFITGKALQAPRAGLQTAAIAGEAVLPITRAAGEKVGLLAKQAAIVKDKISGTPTFYANIKDVNTADAQSFRIADKDIDTVAVNNPVKLAQDSDKVLGTIAKGEASPEQREKMNTVLDDLQYVKEKLVEKGQAIISQYGDDLNKYTAEVYDEFIAIKEGIENISRVQNRFQDFTSAESDEAINEAFSAYQEKVQAGEKPVLEASLIKRVIKAFGSNPGAVLNRSDKDFKAKTKILYEIAENAGSAELAAHIAGRVLELKIEGAARRDSGTKLNVKTFQALNTFLEGDANFVGVLEYVESVRNIVNIALDSENIPQRAAALKFIQALIFDQFAALKAAKLTRQEIFQNAINAYDSTTGTMPDVNLAALENIDFTFKNLESLQLVLDNINEELSLLNSYGKEIGELVRPLEESVEKPEEFEKSREAKRKGKTQQTSESTKQLAVLQKATKDPNVKIVGREEASKALSPANLEALDFLGKILNKKIVLFSSTNKSVNGFINAKTPTTIYINLDTKRSHIAVLGHEFTHTLKIDNPEVYLELAEQLTPLINSEILDRYKNALNATKNGSNTLDDDAILEEAIADLIGTGFTDAKFWDRAAGTLDKNLFEQLLRSFKVFIDNVLALIGFNEMQGVVVFKDYEKARDIAADAMGKHLSAPVYITEGLLDGQSEIDIIFKDNDPIKMSIEGFHGSSSTPIKKFSNKFIGSGTGMQVLGWGLYFDLGSGDLAKGYVNHSYPKGIFGMAHKMLAAKVAASETVTFVTHTIQNRSVKSVEFIEKQVNELVNYFNKTISLQDFISLASYPEFLNAYTQEEQKILKAHINKFKDSEVSYSQIMSAIEHSVQEIFYSSTMPRRTNHFKQARVKAAERFFSDEEYRKTLSFQYEIGRMYTYPLVEKYFQNNPSIIESIERTYDYVEQLDLASELRRLVSIEILSDFGIKPSRKIKNLYRDPFLRKLSEVGDFSTVGFSRPLKDRIAFDLEAQKKKVINNVPLTERIASRLEEEMDKRKVPGSLYKVRIDIDPETDFLMLDKPLTEMHEEIKSKLKLLQKKVPNFTIAPNDTGKDIALNLETYLRKNSSVAEETAAIIQDNKELGGEFFAKKTSLLLNSVGIKGYMSGREYSPVVGGVINNNVGVIFDDSLIEIIERNGISVERPLDTFQDEQEKPTIGQEASDIYYESPTVSNAVKEAREAVRKLLTDLGFKFVEQSDVNINDIQRIASKYITGLHNDDPKFLNDAAKALAYALFYDLDVTPVNRKAAQIIRNWLEISLYRWMLLGETPKERRTLWVEAKNLFAKLISAFKSEEYINIEDKLEELINKIKVGADLSYKPKKGYNKISFQSQIDNNPIAKQILVSLSQSDFFFTLTGSIAYADQVSVYRDADKPLHDLDLLVKSEDRSKIRRYLNKEYAIEDFYRVEAVDIDGIIVLPKQYEIRNKKSVWDSTNKIPRRSYDVYEIATGKKVGSYNFVGGDNGFEKHEGITGVVVDLISDPKQDFITQEFTDTDTGISHTIQVVSYIGGFASKLQLLRSKDVNDFKAATFSKDEVLSQEIDIDLLTGKPKPGKSRTAQAKPSAQEAKPPSAEVENELNDVANILDILGVKGSTTKKASTENAFNSASILLNQIRSGAPFKLENVFNWVTTEGREFVGTPRRERATKKVAERAEKAEITEEQFYGLQLLEEVYEFMLEETLSSGAVKGIALSNFKNQIAIQKAILKTIRFGTDTVIKDGTNKGKTNIAVLRKLTRDTLLNIDTTFELLELLERNHVKLLASSPNVEGLKKYNLRTITYKDTDPYSVTVRTPDGLLITRTVHRNKEEAEAQERFFSNNAQKTNQEVSIELEKAKKQTIWETPHINTSFFGLTDAQEKEILRIAREKHNALLGMTISQLRNQAKRDAARVSKYLDAEGYPTEVASQIYIEIADAEDMANFLEGEPYENLMPDAVYLTQERDAYDFFDELLRQHYYLPKNKEDPLLMEHIRETMNDYVELVSQHALNRSIDALEDDISGWENYKLRREDNLSQENQLQIELANTVIDNLSEILEFKKGNTKGYDAGKSTFTPMPITANIPDNAASSKNSTHTAILATQFAFATSEENRKSREKIFDEHIATLFKWLQWENDNPNSEWDNPHTLDFTTLLNTVIKSLPDAYPNKAILLAIQENYYFANAGDETSRILGKNTGKLKSPNTFFADVNISADLSYTNKEGKRITPSAMGGSSGIIFNAKWLEGLQKLYERGGNILASTMFVETYAHELVHVIAVNELKNNIEFRNSVHRIYNEVVTKLSVEEIENQYGIRNPDEFLAEALSNPDFQRVLAGVPITHHTIRKLRLPPLTDALKALVSQIVKVLGFKSAKPLFFSPEMSALTTTIRVVNKYRLNQLLDSPNDDVIRETALHQDELIKLQEKELMDKLVRAAKLLKQSISKYSTPATRHLWENARTRGGIKIKDFLIWEEKYGVENFGTHLGWSSQEIAAALLDTIQAIARREPDFKVDNTLDDEFKFSEEVNLDIQLPPNLQDPRLKRDIYRSGIKSLVKELIPGGGIAVVYSDYVEGSGDQKLSRRTPSENPEWYKDMDPANKLTVADAKVAVDKALAGQRLGAKQVRFVTSLLWQVQEEREDPEEIEYAIQRRDEKRAERLREKEKNDVINISAKGKMTFAYGNNKREGIKASTTLEAIKTGERTATTRYESDGHIDYWKNLKVGDIIEWTGKNNEKVLVKVTKPLHKLVGSGKTPEQWSQLEGWSVEYFNSKVKPKLDEAWQIEYELFNVGTSSKPDVILPIGTSGSGKSTFIKTLPQKNLVVIEPDAMRIEFTGDINDKSKDNEIYIEAAKRAIAAIKQGKQVVFDTTNLTKEKRRPFIEAIRKEIPNANIQYKLMPLDPELAKQRIKEQLARGENRAAVSDETIDRHAASYKQMLEDIKSEGMTEYQTEAPKLVPSLGNKLLAQLAPIVAPQSAIDAQNARPDFVLHKKKYVNLVKKWFKGKKKDVLSNTAHDLIEKALIPDLLIPVDPSWTEPQTQAVEAFIELYKQVDRVLTTKSLADIKNISMNVFGKDITASVFQNYDSNTTYLNQILLDDRYTIPTEIKAAIALAITRYVMKHGTTLNDLPEEFIAKSFGLSDDDINKLHIRVPEVVVDRYRHIGIDANMVVSDVGRDAWNMLSLYGRYNYPEHFEQNIEVVLGALAQYVMENARQYFTVTEMQNEDYFIDLEAVANIANTLRPSNEFAAFTTADALSQVKFTSNFLKNESFSGLSRSERKDKLAKLRAATSKRIEELTQQIQSPNREIQDPNQAPKQVSQEMPGFAEMELKSLRRDFAFLSLKGKRKFIKLNLPKNPASLKGSVISDLLGYIPLDPNVDPEFADSNMYKALLRGRRPIPLSEYIFDSVFKNTSELKMPTLKPVTKDYKEDTYVHPKEARDNLNALNQNKFKVNTGVARFLSIVLRSNSRNKNLQLLGKVDLDTLTEQNMPNFVKETQEGKNVTIDTSIKAWESFIDIFSNTPLDALRVYLSSGFQRIGRTQIEDTGVNPLLSKEHRSLLIPDSVVMISTDAYAPENWIRSLAILQKMDQYQDLQSEQDVVLAYKELVSTWEDGLFEKALQAYTTFMSITNPYEEGFGELTEEDFNTLKSFMEKADSPLAGVEVLDDELNRRKYQSSKAYQTNLVASMDGIANGLMLSIFFLANNGSAKKEILNVLGIFFEDSIPQTLSDLDSSVRDGYEKPIEPFIESLKLRSDNYKRHKSEGKLNLNSDKMVDLQRSQIFWDIFHEAHGLSTAHFEDNRKKYRKVMKQSLQAKMYGQMDNGTTNNLIDWFVDAVHEIIIKEINLHNADENAYPEEYVRSKIEDLNTLLKVMVGKQNDPETIYLNHNDISRINIKRTMFYRDAKESKAFKALADIYNESVESAYPGLSTNRDKINSLHQLQTAFGKALRDVYIKDAVKKIIDANPNLYDPVTMNLPKDIRLAIENQLHPIFTSIVTPLTSENLMSREQNPVHGYRSINSKESYRSAGRKINKRKTELEVSPISAGIFAVINFEAATSIRSMLNHNLLSTHDNHNVPLDVAEAHSKELNANLIDGLSNYDLYHAFMKNARNSAKYTRKELSLIRDRMQDLLAEDYLDFSSENILAMNIAMDNFINPQSNIGLSINFEKDPFRAMINIISKPKIKWQIQNFNNVVSELKAARFKQFSGMEDLEFISELLDKHVASETLSAWFTDLLFNHQTFRENQLSDLHSIDYLLKQFSKYENTLEKEMKKRLKPTEAITRSENYNLAHKGATAAEAKELASRGETKEERKAKGEQKEIISIDQDIKESFEVSLDEADRELERETSSPVKHGSTPLTEEIEFAGSGTVTESLKANNLFDWLSILQHTGDRSESDKNMEAIMNGFSMNILRNLDEVKMHYNATGRNPNAAVAEMHQTGWDLWINASSTINNAANKRPQNGIPQSGAELLAHDMWHVLTSNLIDNKHPLVSQLRKVWETVRDRELVKPEDLIPDGYNEPDALERAQATWNYIFKPESVNTENVDIAGFASELKQNTSNHLHEFLAYAKTNQKMREALAVMIPSDPNKEIKNRIAKVLNAITVYIGKKLGRFVFDPNVENKTVLEQFDNMVEQMFVLETLHQSKIIKALKNVASGTRYIQNKALSVGRFALDSARLSAPFKAATGRYGKFFNAATEYLQIPDAEMKRQTLKPLVEWVENHTVPIDFFGMGDIIAELRGTTDRSQWAADVIRYRNTYETKERQEVMTAALKVLTAPFLEKGETKVSEEVKLALMNFILTDSAALLDDIIRDDEGYNIVVKDRDQFVDELTNLLDNPSALQAEIAKAQHEVAKIAKDKDLGYILHNAAYSLGHYLVTGQYLNAIRLASIDAIIKDAIQERKKQDKNFKPNINDKLLAFHLNRLGTLEALTNLTVEQKKESSDILKLHRRKPAEEDGVFKLISTHKMLQDKALRSELFIESPLYFRKGYFREVASNPDITPMVANESDGALLERMGYEKVAEIAREPGDPYSEKQFLYITHYSATSTEKLQGALSHASRPSIGRSLHTRRERQVVEQYPDGSVLYNTDLDLTVMSRDRSAKIKKLNVPVNRQASKTIYKTNTLLVEDDKGNLHIKDFKGQMSWDAKVKHLKTKQDPFEILSHTAGNHVSKVRARKVNETVIMEMIKDYKTNRANLPANAYIYISPESTDKVAQERWALIPKETREFIHSQTGEHGIYVRKDLALHMFGYRQVSLRNLMDWLATNHEEHAKLKNFLLDAINYQLAGYKVGQGAYRLAVFTEDFVKDLVGITKDTIVVKSIVVNLINILSNTVQLTMNGMALDDAIVFQAEAMTNAIRYSKDHSQRRELNLQLQQLRGNSPVKADLKSKIAELDDNIARNPVTPLMNAGVMQTIVEDIEAYALGDPDFTRKPISRFLNAGLDASPKWLRTSLSYAFMGRDTEFYKWANNAVKLSDFVARYALDKHLQNVAPKLTEKERMSRIMAEFIDYDIPTNRWIQYLNDVGLLWFTKYGLRSAGVATRLMVLYPENVIRVLLMEQLFGDISTVIDFNAPGRFGDPISKGIDAMFDQATLSAARAVFPGE